MSPIRWALRPLTYYADFNGRSPRAEYWWFTFLEWIALAALMILSVSFAGDSKQSNPFFGAFIVPFLIAFVGLIIPNIAVQVRRMHDQDRSGWFVLLFYIPYVGGLIALVFMCVRGTEGPNRFGPDPYGNEEEHLAGVFA